MAGRGADTIIAHLGVVQCVYNMPSEWPNSAETGKLESASVGRHCNHETSTSGQPAWLQP